jgi:hypothetical protein
VDRRTLFAVGSFVVSAILTAIGTFSGSDDNQFWQWLVVLVVTAVGVGVVFWVVVPRFQGGTGGAALVLSLVALVSLAVFWLGLPVPIAAGAVLLGLDARDRPGARPAFVNGAFAISVFVLLFAVIAAVMG